MATSQADNQCQTLFEQPLSRVKDPPTSFLAAKKLRSLGKWDSQKQAVLAELQRHPGSTSAEIAQEMGGDRHIPARRLSELERGGLVRRGTVRVCQVTKNKCVIWWPVKEANLF